MQPWEIIRSRRFLPAVSGLESPSDAVSLAKAFLDGGLDVMEITLRHESALDCIAAVATQVPAMCCGAGTVLCAGQVEAATAAGAKFGVAPGFHPATIEAANGCGWPFMPGVATPGEIEQASALGCRLLKFFPSEALGGVGFLKAISGPYARLGIGLVPMGGVTEENLDGYFSVPLVAAVGMSALAPVATIHAGDWAAITETVRRLLRRAGTTGDRAGS